MNTHFVPSRRDSSRAAARLLSAFRSAGPMPSDALAAAAARPQSRWRSTEVDSFLAIDAKGMVTVYSGKVDLGTGVRTALVQIAAEELDVPFSAVTVVKATRP